MGACFVLRWSRTLAQLSMGVEYCTSTRRQPIEASSSSTAGRRRERGGWGTLTTFPSFSADIMPCHRPFRPAPSFASTLGSECTSAVACQT